MKHVSRANFKFKTQIKKLILQRGFNADLNDVKITTSDLNGLFRHSKFNGDISKWDTSEVEDMSAMFEYSKFNGDISEWDTSNVEDMKFMFYNSKFNGDISKWDVRKVKDADYMFANTTFNGDISEWNFTNLNYLNFFNNEKMEVPINILLLINKSPNVGVNSMEFEL